MGWESYDYMFPDSYIFEGLEQDLGILIVISKEGNKWRYDDGPEHGIIVSTMPAPLFDTLEEAKRACIKHYIGLLEQGIKDLRES